MTRRLVAALVLLASGCIIEGQDPNSCHVDRDCNNGRLCSQMQQCESPEHLFDLTAHWTFNGAAPTSESCAAFVSFMVGASDASNGFGEDAVCAAGVSHLPHVPTSMTTVKATAYQYGAGGTLTVAGSAEVQRAGATDVTLDFVLP